MKQTLDSVIKQRWTEKTDISRRRVLKLGPRMTGAVIMAGRLPGSWLTPAVVAVTLPAHAVTTEVANQGVDEATAPACVELLDTPVGTIVVPCSEDDPG